MTTVHHTGKYCPESRDAQWLFAYPVLNVFPRPSD